MLCTILNFQKHIRSRVILSRRFALGHLFTSPYCLSASAWLKPYIRHAWLFNNTDQESMPIPATWGLVPYWVNDNAGKLKIWNNTLNARGESIFEKPSFRDAAKSKRCLIYLDGFYEHHHINGKTYPFFIRRKDSAPFPVAALWFEWQDRANRSKLITFSIVTTVGNQMFFRMQNNPKLEGPRIPVILPDELAEE